jgi:hypothetical protein
MPAHVSLCLIVKDEEAHLPACLGSAADLVDEIIVVDTGSTDGTKEIATACGARVFDFAWVDDFSAARNAGLRHASGNWVFWLDADERLDEPNRQRLRALFAGLPEENAAYGMKCRCLAATPHGSATVVDHVRLFRRHPQLRWTYRVHEQILPALGQLGYQIRWTDVVLDHSGYQDPARHQAKQQRNLRLLRLQEADDPDEPFTLFNLGWAVLELGQPAQALPYLRRSLQRAHPGASIVRKLYALLAQAHGLLGQPGAALAACRAGRARYSDDAELLFREGLLRCAQGDLAGAAACWQQLWSSQPPAPPMPTPGGGKAASTGSASAGPANTATRWATRRWPTAAPTAWPGSAPTRSAAPRAPSSTATATRPTTRCPTTPASSSPITPAGKERT